MRDHRPAHNSTESDPNLGGTQSAAFEAASKASDAIKIESILNTRDVEHHRHRIWRQILADLEHHPFGLVQQLVGSFDCLATACGRGKVVPELLLWCLPWTGAGGYKKLKKDVGENPADQHLGSPSTSS
ncbi:MAG: hypothetical protein AAGG11_09990 [Pseudomonadota bacterium]